MTWVPDGFHAATPAPQVETTQARTVQKSVKTTGIGAGRLTVSGAAMLTAMGKAVSRSGLNVRTRRTRAQQGQSTKNGKKGHPSQLNLPKLIKMGGQPELRAGFTTDNGNVILDVKGLDLTDPRSMESKINLLAGVVDNGIFAERPADMLLIGGGSGVQQIKV